MEVYLVENIADYLVKLNQRKKEDEKIRYMCAYSRDSNKLKEYCEGIQYKTMGVTYDVAPMSKMEDCFIGSINDKYKLLENIIILRKIIENLRENRQGKGTEVLDIIDNNPKEFLDSIQFTLENGINLEEFFKNSGELEEVFKTIYNAMIVTDNYREYIERRIRLSNSKDFFDEVLNEFIKKTFQRELSEVEEVKGSNYKEIFVLINFDVITPPQIFLIDLLEKYNYKVIFVAEAKYVSKRNQEENNIPLCNMIYHETYEGVGIQYIPGKVKRHRGDRFLDGYAGDIEKAKKGYSESEEGKVSVYKCSSKVRIVEFSSGNRMQGIDIFSLNKKEDENLSNSISASLVSSISKFNTTCFGRFVLAIYSMYDSTGDPSIKGSMVKFNDDILKKCFLYDKFSINYGGRHLYAKKYYGVLEKLVAYLEPLNNRSAKTWIDAIDKQINRKDRLRLDYVNMISFKIDMDSLKVIKIFLERLVVFAEVLFIVNDKSNGKTRNYTLIDYMQRVVDISNYKSLLSLDESDIEELNVLHRKVTDMIQDLSQSNVIRTTMLRGSEFLNQVNEFLMSMSDGNNNPEEGVGEILSFSNSTSLNPLYKPIKTVITSFDKDNCMKVGEPTLPFSKYLMGEYIEKSDAYKRGGLNKKLMDASFNIINTVELQFFNHLYKHLKNGGNIEFVRYSEDGVDNASYIEELLCEIFSITVEDLDDREYEEVKPHKIPFSLDEFCNIDEVVGLIYDKIVQSKSKSVCLRKIMYEIFQEEIVKQYGMFEANFPNMLVKAYPKNFLRKYLGEITNTMLPGMYETDKSNKMNITWSLLSQETGSKAGTKWNEKIIKDGITHHLTKEGILLAATRDVELCKRCSYDCNMRLANIKMFDKN